MRYRLKSDPSVECERESISRGGGLWVSFRVCDPDGNAVHRIVTKWLFDTMWEPEEKPVVDNETTRSAIEDEIEEALNRDDLQPICILCHRAVAEIRRLKRENESLSIQLAAAIKSHAPCDVEQANKGCPENPAPWNPRAFARRVRQYLESMGRRNAALAIIPDDLFEEAKQEVARRNEFIGVFGNETDDILLDGITRLVGFTKAHDELLKYRKVLVALK